MAKKKQKKKRVVKNPKLTDDEKEEMKAEGELPKKSIRARENRQLIWFFVIVAVIFGSFLVPYFWVESSKVFEYGGIDWAIEEYAEPTGMIYHGRFLAFNNPGLTFNVFFRIDPRENDVRTEGVFDNFWSQGVIGFSPEVDSCRGQLSRVMLDLGSFLKTGVGLHVLETGSTDESVANETGRVYASCDTGNDKTIVIVDISQRDDSGEPGESVVIQDDENPNCYRIYAKDCNDVSSVEKFIFKSVGDFFAE